MAHQVFDLDATEYRVGSVSKRWLKSPRVLVDSALCPSGETRYLDLVVARRENTRGGVFHFEPVATGSRTNGHDLSAQVESTGIFRIAVGDSHFDFPVSGDGDDAEPYAIDFSGDTQTAFNTWRNGNLPNIGTVAATFTIWDGQGTSPFADTTPPSLVSAETTVSGAFIHLTYDEALDTASTPANSAFTLSVTPSGGVAEAVAIDGVTITGSTVVLTPASFIPEGAAAALSYVVPAESGIQDLAGNFADAFSNQPVTVRTDRTAPAFVSAATDAAGEVITVTFSETLDTAHLPAVGAFGVQVAGSARAVAANGAAISGSTVTLTLASAVANGETVTVAYTQPGSAQASTRLQDAAGNEVATFAAQAVANNVPVDDSATDLVNITLTTRVIAADDESWWRETDGVPAAVLRQAADATITVRAFNYGNPFPARDVYADMPQLTADIESRAGEIVYETTDGTELFRFDFPAYDSVNATYQSPDQSIASAAAFTAYTGDLVFRVTLGVTPIAGKGSAALTLQPATLTVTPTAYVEGKGSAVLALQGAALTVVEPTPAAISGKANAALALQPAVITHTAPADVAISGKGSSSLALQPATTILRIRPVFVEGKSSSAIALQPAAMRVTSPTPVAVSGKGNAALTLRPATLRVTVPSDIAIAGKGRADLRAQPAVLTVTNPDAIAISGKPRRGRRGSSIALQSATLTVNRAANISGKGSSSLALQPAVARHVPMIDLSGKGSSAIALQPAVLTFVEALIPPSDELPPIGTPDTPVGTPSDIPAVRYSESHARDLTRTSDLFALKIEHPDLTTPIRIVADNLNITVDGEEFTALAFRAVPPNFQEGESPRAVLEIDNIGRDMTRWVELTSGGRGAMMEVMQVVRDPNIRSVGFIVWRLPALPVGVTEVTNETIQVSLAYRTGRSRPGIKIRHTYEVSPGCFS